MQSIDQSDADLVLDIVLTHLDASSQTRLELLQL